MATVTVSPAPRRPVAELTLLIASMAAGLSGYALTGLNRSDSTPANLWIYAAILTVLSVIAYVGVRCLAPYADPIILPMAVALTGIGLAMISRLDLSYKILESSSYTGGRQLIWVGLAIVCSAIVLTVIRDHRVLRRYTYTAMILSVLLLVLPFVPGIGQEINGARVWIRLGPLSAQPAEFVKVTLPVFFAGYLVANRDKLSVAGAKFTFPAIAGRQFTLRLPRLSDLLPIATVWAVAILILVAQRDLGTSLLLFGLFVAMLYVATNRVSWLVIGGVPFVGAIILAVHLFSHVAHRFNIWLHAFDNDLYNLEYGSSYQVVQGQFGMASGGLFGAGWGRGYPQIVPFANSDFILSSLGEELGLTGLFAILMIYLILIERGMRAAIGVRDGFGKLLAAGISFSLALQLFVVLGGITRVIPLTGLTAPFLAQGGSSMLTSWVLIALLIRISDASRRPSTPAQPFNQTSPEQEVSA